MSDVPSPGPMPMPTWVFLVDSRGRRTGNWVRVDDLPADAWDQVRESGGEFVVEARTVPRSVDRHSGEPPREEVDPAGEREPPADAVPDPGSGEAGAVDNPRAPYRDAEFPPGTFSTQEGRTFVPTEQGYVDLDTGEPAAAGEVGGAGGAGADNPFGFPPIPEPPGEETEPIQPGAVGIGIPEGFIPPGGGPPSSRRGELYQQGDVSNLLSRMTANEVATFQRRARELGLLGDDFQKGQWDDQGTVEAFERTLGFANRRRVSFQAALDEMAEMGLAEQEPQFEAPGRTEFVPPTREIPAPETLAADLREWWQQELGRQPSEFEVDRFTNAMLQADEARFDQEVEIAEAEFEREQTERIAQQMATETGEDVDPRDVHPGGEAGGVGANLPDSRGPGGYEPGPAGFEDERQMRDPVAEVREQIRQHMQPEIDLRERQEAAAGRGVGIQSALSLSMM